MEKFKVKILLLAGLIVALNACKKEEENPQAFIQQKLIGKWPIKYNIKTTFTNEVETKNDTLVTYNPIDTLVFTAEGQAIRRNKTVISTVGYTISADGENITFNSTPASTVKIIFVRITSIGLGTETVAQVSGKTIKTQIADHLIK